jgi:hypothetical protein
MLQLNPLFSLVFAQRIQPKPQNPKQLYHMVLRQIQNLMMVLCIMLKAKSLRCGAQSVYPTTTLNKMGP